MPFYEQDGRRIWYPDLFDKQLDVFNSTARALLVYGARLSGKTRAVLHRIVRHLWETDGARVGFFARTLKSSKDGGAWALLHNAILKEWFKAKIGMRYTTESKGVYGPRTDGITRTLSFKVSNVHKTESEVMLFSLDNDDDVEAKLKELEFSMIYFSELDKFGDRRVLTVALPSLRMGHLRFEDQSWISDCNPSEEGDASWIYQLFFRERLMGYEDYLRAQKEQDLPLLSQDDFERFYGQLDVISIQPEENPRVDARQLQEVRVACGSDQGLYARHVKGEWVWGGGDASRHFRALWGDGSRHIVDGTTAEGVEEDWIIAKPSQNCFELITGWDLGETNHAAVILERYQRRVTSRSENGQETSRYESCFVVLDELVSIGHEVSNDEFTCEFMDLIKQIEADAGRTFNLDRAWSDRSSLEKYSSSGDTYPYLQVHDASEGRITLQGVRKPTGSVRIRVQELKKFLAHGRIKVSAHCKYTIKMFRDLKKGKDKTNYVVPTDENKHVFDAISYAILAECAEELESGPKTGRKEQALEVHIA